MGLCTESGELLDQLKKHIFYGEELDLTNIEEEGGDFAWYLAEIINALDVKFIDMLQKNIDKLRVRYPEKFTEEKALNRDLEKEREILEANWTPVTKWENEPKVKQALDEFKETRVKFICPGCGSELNTMKVCPSCAAKGVKFIAVKQDG